MVERESEEIESSYRSKRRPSEEKNERVNEANGLLAETIPESFHSPRWRGCANHLDLAEECLACLRRVSQLGIIDFFFSTDSNAHRSFSNLYAFKTQPTTKWMIPR